MYFLVVLFYGGNPKAENKKEIKKKKEKKKKSSLSIFLSPPLSVVQLRVVCGSGFVFRLLLFPGIDTNLKNRGGGGRRTEHFTAPRGRGFFYILFTGELPPVSFLLCLCCFVYFHVHWMLLRLFLLWGRFVSTASSSLLWFTHALA